MLSPGEILARYDLQMRRNFPGTAAQRIERTAEVTRALGGTAGAEYGAILFSALTEQSADTVVRTEIERFRGLGRALEWKAYAHDRPADLADRLSRLGFRPGDRETLLCREIAPPLDVPVPPGIRLRRLDAPADCDVLSDFDEAAGEAANESLLDELRAELEADRARLSIYIAYDGDRPVARAWIRYYPEREFADLWAGQTLRSHRKRGIYRALVAARLAEARGRGVRFATTDALPTSHPILEKLGFFPLTTTRGHLWVPLS